MCIIATAEKRKLTYEEIKHCFLTNPNGAGLAWSKGGKNYFKKGLMTLETFWEFYKCLKVLPHVAHFRIATSGGVNQELTHPFEVSINSPISLEGSSKHPLLFHNGIITDWKERFLQWTPEIIRELRRRKMAPILPDGPWSDTRTVAIITAYSGISVLNFISGKFVVINNNIIKTYGEFETAKGIHFSNSGYMPAYNSINSGYWERGGTWQWQKYKNKESDGADLSVLQKS